MAKKRAQGINKSQKIRDYLAGHPDAGPKQVADALNADGLGVSEQLVSNVKYNMAKPTKSRKKKAGKKKPVKKRGGAKKTTQRKKSAARRAGVNKSQAIRDYLDRHPAATPKEIVAALAGQGLDVSMGLVSVVKYGAKRKTPKGKKRKKVARGRAAAGVGGLSVEDLVAVKGLADRLGGAANLRQALELLERLS
jgi:hypothetical protein